MFPVLVNLDILLTLNTSKNVKKYQFSEPELELKFPEPEPPQTERLQNPVYMNQKKTLSLVRLYEEGVVGFNSHFIVFFRIFSYCFRLIVSLDI